MRIRTLLKYLVFFYILLFSFSKIESFIEQDYFKITEVEVYGNYSILENDVVKQLSELKGKNIWYINEEVIEEYLSNDIRITNVKIKKVIPDRIEVSFEERSPYVYVLDSNRVFVADNQGVTFGYREEFASENLIVTEVKKDSEKFRIIYETIEKLNENLEKSISEIYIESEIITIILNDGTKIRSSEEVGERKYEIGYKLYLKLKSMGDKIEYIDLRFNDYIVK